MKKSMYSIPLKVDEDEYLLINSRTGAVDLVDSDVIEFLTSDLSQGDPSIIEFLTERGHITVLSPEEELNHIEEICTSLHAKFSRVKSHYIIPTYKCNLQCTYCWEQLLHSKGKAWVEKTLSFEEADLLFEAFDILDKRVSEKKPLIYFGGEPMLPENIELINYMMRKGTRKGYVHYFVTNGTTIPLYLPLLKKYPIRGVQITVDGTQPVHDSRRKGPKGEGSFQRIVEGIELLRAHNIKTYIRVNVDKVNIGSIGELAAFLKERGWDQDQSIVPYLIPVFPHRCEGYSKAYTKEASISKLISLWDQDDLWKVFKKGIVDFHPIESVINGGEWSPRFFCCQAHCNQLFFDSHGDIYTCGEAVGEKEHCVGHFIPSLEFNKTYENWMKRTVFAIEKCRNCEYAFLCGGGCAYAAYTEKKTLFAPVCGTIKRVLEEYIPFYYHKFLKQDAL